MIDISTIGIEFQTSGLEKGTAALKNAEQAANRTADAADKVSNSSRTLTNVTDMVTSAIKAATSAFGAYKLLTLAQDATMLAARYETMGVVMRVAGNNAGYTMAQMQGLSKELQQSGISMLQSRNSLTQLATANIDLANATKLGRAAQDLAVVGNINSSEALGRMIQGIKSGEVEILRTLGLNVSFESSYKKMAAQIGTNSDSLTEHQKVIARTNAAIEEAARYNGIYEESLGTAGKALNSLTRYWEDLKVKAGESFLPALTDAVFNLTDALKAANVELEKAGSSGTIGSIGQGLSSAFKTVYETVVVLGANVSYVFNAIGQFIGGFAAQVAALLTGDFKAVGVIQKNMVADSDANRKAIDAFSDTILNGAQKQVAASKMTEAERISAGKAAKDAGDAQEKQAAQTKALSEFTKQYGTDAQKSAAAIKEWKAKLGDLYTPEFEAKLNKHFIKPNAAARQELKAAESQYASLMLKVNERIELAGEELKAGRQLTEAEKQEIKLAEMLDSAKGKLSATARAAIEGKLGEARASEMLVQQQRTNLAFAKDLADAEIKRVQAMESALPGMADQNKALTEEIELMGLGEAAQLAITQARLSSVIAIKEEQLARLQNTEFMSREQIALEEEIRLLKERMSLQGQRADKNIAVAQAKEAGDAWKSFNADLERGLTDSLFRAFESGKGFFKTLWDGIKNLFKTTVLKLVIQGVMGGVTGGASGLVQAATGATGQGGSLMGLVNNASTLYSAVTGGGLGATASGLIGSGVSALFGATAGNAALGGALGLGAGSATAAALAAAEAGGMALSAGATAMAGSMGSLGASLAAAAGPIGLAMAGIALVSAALSKKDSRHGGGYEINAGQTGATYTGGPDRGFTGDANVAAAVAATSGSINQLLKTIGSTTSLTTYYGASETSNKGRGGVMAGGMLSNGTAFGEDRVGSNYNGDYFENTSTQSPDGETAAANLALDLKQSIIQALQATTDIPAVIKGMVAGIDIELSDSAAVDKLLGDINQVVLGVTSFQAAVKALPFAYLRDMSFDTAASFIAAAGGMEALNAKLGTYYDNFYKEDEKRVQTVKGIVAALNAAGSSLTVADFSAGGMMDTREEFRALVEQTDAKSPLFQALLNVNQAFADITPVVDLAAQALEAANAAQANAEKMVQGAKENLISAYEREADAMQNTADKFRAFAKDLRGFRDSLLTGSLSPLTPGQRYAETSGQFDRLLAATQSTSESEREAALGQLQGASTALLEASKLYNASGSGYVMDFDRVQEVLGSAAIGALATADVAQLQLDAAHSQLIALGQIDQSVMTVADAIAALAAAQQLVGTDNALSLPSFAVGTNYVPRDMVAQIHEGEAIVPRAYNPAAGGQSNDALAAEIRALRLEVQQLREQNNQGHAMNAQATAESADHVAKTVATAESRAAWSKTPELL